MNIEDHIGHTVGIIYTNPKTENIDKRTGIIITTTINKVALLLSDDDEDIEVMIPKKNIHKICKPWELTNSE